MSSRCWKVSLISGKETGEKRKRRRKKNIFEPSKEVNYCKGIIIHSQ